MMRRLLSILAVAVVAICAAAPASAQQWGQQSAAAQQEETTGRLLECLKGPVDDPRVAPQCREEMERLAAFLDESIGWLSGKYKSIIDAAEGVGRNVETDLAGPAAGIGAVAFAIWLAVQVAGVVTAPIMDEGAITKGRSAIIKGLFGAMVAGAVSASGSFSVVWDGMIHWGYMLAAGVSSTMASGVYAAIGTPQPAECALAASTVGEVGGCSLVVVGATMDIGLRLAETTLAQIGPIEVGLPKMLAALALLFAFGIFSLISFLRFLDRGLPVVILACMSPLLVWLLPYEKGRTACLHALAFLVQALLQFVVMSVLLAILVRWINAEIAAASLKSGGWGHIFGLSLGALFDICFAAAVGTLSLPVVEKVVDKVTEPIGGHAGGLSMTSGAAKMAGMTMGVAFSKPVRQALLALKTGGAGNVAAGVGGALGKAAK